MGVKNFIEKVGNRTGNAIATLSKLSSDQVEEIVTKREEFLKEMWDPQSSDEKEKVLKLLASNSIEIFNDYLKQLKELYLPISYQEEFGNEFIPDYNIRYFNITKWVKSKEENSLEKLVNVYAVLKDEKCNIALVFNRTMTKTNVYLAVINTGNVGNSTDVKNYKERLVEAIKGNFPGSFISNDEKNGVGVIPPLDNDLNYSVAIASNIPAEKSEKFLSQTIEKLLDGIIPENSKQEYTIVLLATPILDLEERKLKLGKIYSDMVPYASWSTSFQVSENESEDSSFNFGNQMGVNVGKQMGTNQSATDSDSNTDNVAATTSESQTVGTSDSNSTSDFKSKSINGGVNASVPTPIGVNIGASVSTSKATGQSTSTGHTISEQKTKSIAKTLGKAITKSTAKTVGSFVSNSFGVNAGINFSRTSRIGAMTGKNEGLTRKFENYNVKHALKILEEEMQRLDQSSALGMWDFAAYILSEDFNVASNVAHSYLALTQGEKSYMSSSSINLWKGSVPFEEQVAKEIVMYLRELRHPRFSLNINLLEEDKYYNLYPSIVDATTSLTGKELAYSLNFPRKSVTGLPVLECAEFGRDVITYNLESNKTEKCKLGHIFHMNTVENTDVTLNIESLSSHTFITGSTGSGKSNTIYKILSRLKKLDKKFLVIEPAKGEYKNIFGNLEDVKVFGTNPKLTPLLKLNPFSFNKDIHILEHIDRLVEIFNVCWPMYAAMPAVLKDAIIRSYLDCGWDTLNSTNKYQFDLFPTFKDVARNIKTIIESSEFDNDNKGAYKGALLVRLNSLTNGLNKLIFTNSEISDQDLFDSNVIVDLSRVASSETKSLIMGILIMKLEEYRMTSNVMNANLRHVTVLEEAHHLLKRTTSESNFEGSNILAKSVEMLANSIAEMRTYGEGFIIADQSPMLLDMSVIRNTNTKIIMRLADKDDRDLVGFSANLNDDQILELAKLPCGVAAIYQNEWVEPVLCKIEKYKTSNELYSYNNNLTLIPEKNTLKTILDCLINKELLNDSKKIAASKIKDKLLASEIDSKVKTKFLDYLECNSSENIEKLSTLCYDLFNSSNIIEEALVNDNIKDFVNYMIENITPTIKDYTKEQQELIIAMLLHEKTCEDQRYIELYRKYTDSFEKGDLW